MRRLAILPALLLAAVLAGCNSGEEGSLDVAFIADEEALLTDGIRLSPGAQHLRGATASGLVSLDADGEVIAGLAERWLITNGGRSFIFRLRDTPWPDGSEMTSNDVRRALLRNIGALDGTSLGLDFAPVDDVRAMAGRVIEIRLSSPVPDMLRLLAQPEMALRHPDGDTGPMNQQREEGAVRLALRPPLSRGLPDSEDWEDFAREISVRAVPAEEALAGFDGGDFAIVLGGGIAYWPMVDTGPLSRGTVRVDPALGLFGLQVREGRGILAEDGLREALAMALDRQALLAPYSVGGWLPTTRLVPPGLPRDPGYIAERWQGEALEDLRARAARRIANWQGGDNEASQNDFDDPRRVTIAIGEAPGYDLLFRELATQLQTVGITLERVGEGEEADLLLVDRTARYASPRWFLNQFHCSLPAELCSEDADFLVSQALVAPDPETRARLLAEAEAALTLANIYIPIATPLRWSLVRGSIDAYLPNQWAYHPLPPLAQIPR